MRERIANRQQPIATKGFTLLELLLAMAVFAAASALVIPVAAGLLADRELARGGDQIRAELTRLRVHAMRQGRVMVLHSDPDSNQLHVAAMFSANDSVEASDSGTMPSALLSGADQAMGPVGSVSASEQEEWTIELPEGLVVRSVVTSAVGGAGSVEAAQLNSASNLNASASGSGSGAAENGTLASGLPPIFFYPTGRTSNAIITLGNRMDGSEAGQSGGANQLGVQIRGLTGDVTLRGNP